MAMIKCRECGKEISSRAEVCPNCGAKTRYGVQSSEGKVAGWILIIGIILGLLGIFLLFSGIQSIQSSSQWYYHYTPSNSEITQISLGGGLIGGAIYAFIYIKKFNSSK